MNNELSKLPEIKKPPIGLMPRFVWEERRLVNIVAAMVRYENAGLEIKSEWIEEYEELNAKIKLRSKYGK